MITQCNFTQLTTTVKLQPNKQCKQDLTVWDYDSISTTDGDGTWTVPTEWGRRWLARWQRTTPSRRAPCMSSGRRILIVVSTICQHQHSLIHWLSKVQRPTQQFRSFWRRCFTHNHRAGYHSPEFRIQLL